MPRVILKASHLYARKKYGQAIKLLETNIFSFRDNPQFYYLLGLVCLRTRDIPGAMSYLRRSYQLNRHNSDTQSLLALAELLSSNPHHAIEHWLEILKREPKYTPALTGLRMLKNGIVEPNRLMESKIFNRLIPVLKNQIIYQYGLIFVIFSVVLMCGLGVYFYITRPPNVIARRGIEQIEIARSQDTIISLDGNPRYILNESQIASLLNTIHHDFLRKKDNDTCKNINYLLHSNTTIQVKQRMSLLSTYLSNETFATISSTDNYIDVKNEPWLYNGCFIRWKGRIANIEDNANHATFDFLIGYEDEKILDGIERSFLTVDYNLDNPQSIEIIGKLHTNEDIRIIEVTDIRPLL